MTDTHDAHQAVVAEAPPDARLTELPGRPLVTAILGRVSAYTGREVNYSWLLNASKLDLTPPAYAWGDAPPVEIPVPGVTPLV